MWKKGKRDNEGIKSLVPKELDTKGDCNLMAVPALPAWMRALLRYNTVLMLDRSAAKCID